LYSAEVYHPFRLELLIVGASGELEDEDKVPRTYEYSKEMFPWESVCALAAVERKRETKPNTVNLRMAEQSFPSLSQEAS